MPRTSPRYPRSGILPLGAVVALVWVAGCSPPSTEQLRQEVLKADPDFSIALEKYRSMNNRIATYQRELELKRSTIERQIAQLRQELEHTAETVKKKTAETRARIKPDQERLELALSMANEQLGLKRVQQAAISRSMAKLRKTLANPKGTWSAEERANYQRQVDDMGRDLVRLDQELKALNEHIRLLKIKLLLIKN